MLLACLASGCTGGPEALQRGWMPPEDCLAWAR